MGHPKKLRKNWKRPKKMFDKSRIEFEKKLKKTYGFKRKREIWKIEYEFKTIKRRARKILASRDKEAEKILTEKINKIGLLSKPSLEEILNLQLEDLCNRRLQTIVQKKGLANTVNHARQLIIHKKVIIGEKIITQPNYIVAIGEEENIKIRKKVKKPAEKKQNTETEVKKEETNAEKSDDEKKICDKANEEETIKPEKNNVEAEKPKEK